LQKTVKASIYKNAENSENFDILQSHNMLFERYLQKRIKLVFTNEAEIGKAQMTQRGQPQPNLDLPADHADGRR